MIAIVFSLIAYVGFALGDFVSVFLSRKVSPVLLTVISFILRVGLYCVLITIFGDSFEKLSIGMVTFNFLIGCSTVLGYVLFYKATAVTNPALVGSIASSWSASALLYSFILLGERISTTQGVFITVILFGIFLISFEVKKLMGITFRKDKGILFAVGVMFLWGVCGSLIKVPIEQYGWFWATLIQLTPSFLLIPFAWKQIKNIKVLLVPKNTAVLFLCVLIILIAESSYNIGLSSAQAAIVAPIGGSYSSLFIILAFVFYKEPISRQQLYGVMLTVMGVIGLSFASV